MSREVYEGRSKKVQKLGRGGRLMEQDLSSGEIRSISAQEAETFLGPERKSGALDRPFERRESHTAHEHSPREMPESRPSERGKKQRSIRRQLQETAEGSAPVAFSPEPAPEVPLPTAPAECGPVQTMHPDTVPQVWRMDTEQPRAEWNVLGQGGRRDRSQYSSPDNHPEASAPPPPPQGHASRLIDHPDGRSAFRLDTQERVGFVEKATVERLHEKPLGGGDRPYTEADGAHSPKNKRTRPVRPERSALPNHNETGGNSAPHAAHLRHTGDKLREPELPSSPAPAPSADRAAYRPESSVSRRSLHSGPERLQFHSDEKGGKSHPTADLPRAHDHMAADITDGAGRAARKLETRESAALHFEHESPLYEERQEETKGWQRKKYQLRNPAEMALLLQSSGQGASTAAIGGTDDNTAGELPPPLVPTSEDAQAPDRAEDNLLLRYREGGGADIEVVHHAKKTDNNKRSALSPQKRARPPDGSAPKKGIGQKAKGAQPLITGREDTRDETAEPPPPQGPLFTPPWRRRKAGRESDGGKTIQGGIKNTGKPDESTRMFLSAASLSLQAANSTTAAEDEESQDISQGALRFARSADGVYRARLREKQAEHPAERTAGEKESPLVFDEKQRPGKKNPRGKNPKAGNNGKKKARRKRIQKQRIKREYAKAIREAWKNGEPLRAAAMVRRRAGGTARQAVNLLVERKHLLILPAVFLLLFLLLSSILSGCMSVLASAGGVLSAEYLADETALTAADCYYSELETDLQIDIDETENNYSFDKYRYNIGEIDHNPFELLAYLTVKHQAFDYPDSTIKAELDSLFSGQYALSRDWSWEVDGFDDDGNPIDVQELTTTLTVTPLSTVIRLALSEDEMEYYYLLMETLGGRQFCGNPFGFNWLGMVSSRYGYRVLYGNKNLHKGVDIAAEEGTEIRAVQDGVVSYAGELESYGYCVLIDGQDGIQSRYAHCSALRVHTGQTVHSGDVIAAVGSTGNSTGPHLHLEIKRDGEYLNPLLFVDTGSDGMGSPLVDYSAYPGEPPTEETFAAILTEAQKYLGYPYVWGGSSPSTSFDCSGYVCWVINHCGWNMGRLGATQLFYKCSPVTPEEAQPGDLIFFTRTYSTSVPCTHVGIYVGNGQMIHCGDPISYTSINTNYWREHFYSFARLPGGTP